MAGTDSQGSSAIVCGRIVWTAGDLFAGKPKLNLNTKQPILKQDGTPLMEYGFGLAVEKSAFAQGGQAWDLYSKMYAEAYQIYPSRQLPPTFAMKLKDGDGVDHNGQPLANRAGHAGHYILSLTTSLPIKFFVYENGAYRQIESGIKCGDYVQVNVQIKAHGPVGQGKPGLYLNPLAVIFAYQGEAIINQPTPDQMFGQAPPQWAMPAGATAIQPSGLGMPPMGAPQAPQAAPGGFPAPGGMPAPQSSPMAAPAPQATSQAPAQSAAPQPFYGVLPQQFQPQAQAPQAAPGGFPAPGGMPAPQTAYNQQQPTGMPGVPQIPGV